MDTLKSLKQEIDLDHMYVKREEHPIEQETFQYQQSIKTDRSDQPNILKADKQEKDSDHMEVKIEEHPIEQEPQLYHHSIKSEIVTCCNSTEPLTEYDSDHTEVNIKEHPIEQELQQYHYSVKSEIIICDTAEKTAEKSDMANIQLISLGKKPYKCSNCDKTFTSNYNLNRHELIHSGKKPYKCSNCDKTFIDKYKLIRHELIHSGKKLVSLSTNPEFAPSSDDRKRKCDPDSWQRNKVKKAHNNGQHYVSGYSGKAVAAKKIGTPCKCLMQCFVAVGDEFIADIHMDYWASGNHNVQTAFIQSCAIEKQVKQHYTGDEARQQSIRRSYQLKAGDKFVSVCKNALASILSISLSRITKAANNKTASGVLIPDMRGRHSKYSISASVLK